MATYRQIREYVSEQYGYVPKTCWIAHVKELNGSPSSRLRIEGELERIHAPPASKLTSQPRLSTLVCWQRVTSTSEGKPCCLTLLALVVT